MANAHGTSPADHPTPAAAADPRLADAAPQLLAACKAALCCQLDGLDENTVDLLEEAVALATTPRHATLPAPSPDQPVHAVDIERVTDDAFDAFWEVIVDRFPEAKSGDLSADQTIRLARAGEEAVREWIDNNVPRQPDANAA